MCVVNKCVRTDRHTDFNYGKHSYKLKTLFYSLQDLESVNRELLEVQRVNGQLHAEMDSLKEQTEEESEKHSLQLQKLRQEMRDMDTKHRREYSETETQYKVRTHGFFFVYVGIYQRRSDIRRSSGESS